MIKLKVDWCDIEDIIGAALRRLGELVRDRPLNVRIPEGIPLIRADCVLLEQVMVNLVDNAVKYSPPGSDIEIRVACNENKIQVSVADRGIGIADQDLPHIFDKFYRSQQPRIKTPGTGLGLSICKSIVEAHGGTIQAENHNEGGALLTFNLPLGEKPPKIQNPGK